MNTHTIQTLFSGTVSKKSNEVTCVEQLVLGLEAFYNFPTDYSNLFFQDAMVMQPSGANLFGREEIHHHQEETKDSTVCIEYEVELMYFFNDNIALVTCKKSVYRTTTSGLKLIESIPQLMLCKTTADNKWLIKVLQLG